MSIDVQPGSQVSVTVTAEPTNEAAAKTLSRVFARDPANRKLRMQRKKLRLYKMDGRQRGGRIWMVRPKAPRLCQPKKGDSCHLFTTSSLINDLRSVSRFVDVKPNG
ncbi:MAG: hypothetical protein MI923_29815 [Phycisphaerales bacterium]|nr:hypothetical protein [Phycisphaerales bacterium]